MKSEGRGQTIAAPGLNDVAEPALPPAPQRRRTRVTGVLVLCCAVIALLLARHAILGFALSRAAAVATGDRINWRSFALGPAAGVFSGVSVATARNDPLFDADRIVVRYSLHDLFFGGPHGYGLTAVTLERPILTIVRRPDGSYNIGAAAASLDRRPMSVQPLRLTFVARIRNGSIRLVDRAPVAPDLQQQLIGGISVDARIASDAVSYANGRGALSGRLNAAAPLRSWPIALAFRSDVARGLAVLRAQAPVFPLRGLLGYLQHSSAVRVDDGLLHGLDVAVFRLDLGLAQRADVHIGGAAALDRGLLTIGALRRPVRDLRGRLILTDDGIWSRRLTGTLAGIPVLARGGAFNRLNPELRLGLRADGDVRKLKTIFEFSRGQAVSGNAHVETLLEAPVANILVRTALRVPHAFYAAIPLADVAGRVDYHHSGVMLDGLRARYGAATVKVGGRILLGSPAPDVAIAVAADGPGRALPYAENLAPEARLDAVALISGGAGYRARGALGAQGPDVAGRAMFAVDAHGVGEFGPFVFERTDGSSLIGALRLERPRSQSAAWLSARRYRIALPPTPAQLGGLRVPAFPPLAGIIDGAAAGGGSPALFALAGNVAAQGLKVGALDLGTGRARLSGSLGDVRLAALTVDGRLGRFTGSAAVTGGALALRGRYDGSLDRLVPLTGNQFAHGTLAGPIAATLNGRDIIVQSAATRLEHASIRGVGLNAAAGTLAVRDKTFHIVVANARIGANTLVAREFHGQVAVSATNLTVPALRGTGVPLDAGKVSLFGLADLRGATPSFAGTVAIAAGRSHGYRVAGDAQVDVAGTQATIDAATGALGSTYGSIAGAVGGIGAPALRYDLRTHVPLGDIGLLRTDLGLPVHHIGGSFSADLHVGGAGARPVVDGTIAAPEGKYNGLAFRDVAARLALDADGLAARAGQVTVGNTRVAVAASTRRGERALAVRSTQANLADFNDFFDADDTLAGRGRFDVDLGFGPQFQTRGELALTGLRYRGFTLGATRSDWHMDGAAINGRISIHSPNGSLSGAGRLTPAAGPDIVQALRAGAYDLAANVARVDLGTWLPAAGLAEPILGTLDAGVRVAGRWPRLRVDLATKLDRGAVGKVAIRSAELRAHSVGTRIDVSSSSADLGFGTLSGTGTLGLGPTDRLAFDLRGTTGNVGPALVMAYPTTAAFGPAGSLDSDIRFSGTRAKPQIAGGFDLANAHYAGFSLPRIIGSLALAGNAIELRDADVEFARGQAFVAGSLPLQVTPLALGPPSAPVSFDVTARDVDLAQFSPLLPSGTRLTGAVNGRFGVQGTVGRAQLFGSLALHDGSYVSTFERAPIRNVDARFAFAGSRVALEAFHAGVGAGTLDASGRISLPFASDAGIRYAFDVAAKGAQLDFPSYGRGTLEGSLQLTGEQSRPLLSGAIAVHDAVIPVAAVYESTHSAGGGPAGVPLNPALALHVTAGNNVRVRSAIVDIGLAGEVDVSGRLQAPQLAGALVATDGSVSSYNHVFRLVNAVATFDPADGVVPTIDARATARVRNPDPDPSRNVAGSANITVSVSGTPDSNNLQVTYSSDPPYSQEQIVGLLLDVPGLLGALNFNLNGGSAVATLRGAPGETNVLLPPGTSPEQVSAISFNQEVFSLLNGQLTQRALGPVERVFARVFGLSDLEFTVDYGGGIGYSLRRQIGKRNFYGFLSQTVTYPERTNLGLELEPKPYETVNLSLYQQTGVTSLITNQTPGTFSLGSTRRLTGLQPLGNRSGFALDLSRRF